MTVPSSSVFSLHAATYDDLRRRLIPCFEDFYGCALKLIDQAGFTGPIRVLDIGAGTGLFAAMVLAHYPEAEIHLIDASTGMLDQARQRFGADNRLHYQLADMATADLAGPWDLIVSALAIHHLDHVEKRSLFGRIRQALKPGGLFVNAEQVAGPTPSAEARYVRIWHEEIRRLGVSEDETVKAAERMAHDRCATVEEQLQWLREAGFSDVDCSFKAWRFAVLSGRS